MKAARFLGFELDLDDGELRRDGAIVPLERQPAIVLTLLVRRAGHLVTRDELRGAIWPDEVHVDFDRGLNYCIRQVRAALDDDARRPLFVETVPRQGYRFVAPLAAAAAAPAAQRRRTCLVASAAIVLALAGAAIWDARIADAGAKSRHHAVGVAVARAAHAFVF
jgi:DNA-binding winged helix-turn-helix (wHTH) protein